MTRIDTGIAALRGMYTRRRSPQTAAPMREMCRPLMAMICMIPLR